MPDPCPVCGKTDLHCYHGKPIHPETWHTLADNELALRVRALLSAADNIDTWAGRTPPSTQRLRDLASRIERGEENYP